MKIQYKNGANILSDVLDGDLQDGTFLFPDGVNIIKKQAFGGCNKLTRIVIPPSVTAIGPFAFYQCKALISVVIPPGVTIIDRMVFAGCGALTSLVISPTVAAIEWGALQSCTALTRIIVDSDIDAEVERIRSLFSEPWRNYVVAKSVADEQQQAVKKTVVEFCRRCSELDTRALINIGDNTKSINYSLPIISEFLKPIGFSPFEKEVLKIPYPKNKADLAVYLVKLHEIKERHIDRYTTMCELEKYICLLEKIHPDSFFASPEIRSKKSDEHRNLRKTLQSIITSLQDGTIVILSDEEKQWIQKPRLLQIIPQQIKEELGIGTGPEPALKKRKVR